MRRPGGWRRQCQAICVNLFSQAIFSFSRFPVPGRTWHLRIGVGRRIVVSNLDSCFTAILRAFLASSLGHGWKRSQRRPFLAALAQRRLGPSEKAGVPAAHPGSQVFDSLANTSPDPLTHSSLQPGPRPYRLLQLHEPGLRGLPVLRLRRFQIGAQPLLRPLHIHRASPTSRRWLIVRWGPCRERVACCGPP